MTASSHPPTEDALLAVFAWAGVVAGLLLGFLVSRAAGIAISSGVVTVTLVLSVIGDRRRRRAREASGPARTRHPSAPKERAA